MTRRTRYVLAELRIMSQLHAHSEQLNSQHVGSQAFAFALPISWVERNSLADQKASEVVNE